MNPVLIGGGRRSTRTTLALAIFKASKGRRLYIGWDEAHAQRLAREAGVERRHPTLTLHGPTFEPCGQHFDTVVIDTRDHHTLEVIKRLTYRMGGECRVVATAEQGPALDQANDLRTGLTKTPAPVRATEVIDPNAIGERSGAWRNGPNMPWMSAWGHRIPTREVVTQPPFKLPRSPWQFWRRFYLPTLDDSATVATDWLHRTLTEAIAGCPKQARSMARLALTKRDPASVLYLRLLSMLDADEEPT